jgi:polyphosphate kinase
MSEKIRVISVVDRFLEHTRAFAFGTGPQVDVYMSSADWMPRNFHRRVEVMAPVEDPALKARILDEVLGSALRDNVKARQLQPDGSYIPVPLQLDGQTVRSQTMLLELARRGGTVPLPPTDPALMRHVASPVEKDKAEKAGTGTAA